MELIISNNLRIKNPSKNMEFYARENLIIPNPEYAKKERMGLYTGRTSRTLQFFTTDGDDLILPYGTLRDISQFFKTGNVSTMFAEHPHIDYGNPIPLYDYQEAAVSRMMLEKYGILQSPAGSGKTRMGLEIIRRYGQRALWLTHTKDLLKQSWDAAKEFFNEDDFGSITEGKVNIGKTITFATVQTMANIDLDLYKHEWGVIVVDECHRVAGSPTSLTQFYKVLNKLSAKHKYGVSATVHRADGLIKATFSILGNVRYAVPDSAVADKIMKVTIQPIQTGIDLDESCLNYDGTIKFASMLTYLATHPWRNEIISNYMIANWGHSMLVLSARLEQLRMLKDMLPEEMQGEAVMIDGTMTSKKGKAEREKAIADMRSGEKKILFASYGLAKEGLDIPRLDRLFMATPEKDDAVIIQSIGRIARTFPGKEKPICYDFTDIAGITCGMSRKRYRIYKKQGCEVLGFK